MKSRTVLRRDKAELLKAALALLYDGGVLGMTPEILARVQNVVHAWKEALRCEIGPNEPTCEVCGNGPLGIYVELDPDQRSLSISVSCPICAPSSEVAR